MASGFVSSTELLVANFWCSVLNLWNNEFSSGMMPRRENAAKSGRVVAKRKSSSEEESSEQGSATTSNSGSESGTTDGSSGSSSGSDSEMDTTETSFSSKSAVECVGTSSKQQGLLKVNHRSYAVFCESGRNCKSFCNSNGPNGVEPLLEEARKEPK